MSGFIKRVAYTKKVGSKKIHVPASYIKSRSQSGLKRIDIDRKKIASLKRIHNIARTKFGTPKCIKGEIVREGFKKKNGTWVKPCCIKDIGAKGKGIQRFVLEKGTLSRFGYHDIKNLKQSERRASLKKAINKLKPTTVMKKVNALYVLNKNKDSKLARLFKKDVKYVRSLPKYKNSLGK